MKTGKAAERTLLAWVKRNIVVSVQSKVFTHMVSILRGDRLGTPGERTSIQQIIGK